MGTLGMSSAAQHHVDELFIADTIIAVFVPCHQHLYFLYHILTQSDKNMPVAFPSLSNTLKPSTYSSQMPWSLLLASAACAGSVQSPTPSPSPHHSWVPQDFEHLGVGGVLAQGSHHIPTLAVLLGSWLSCFVKELESLLELCGLILSEVTHLDCSALPKHFL